MHQFENEQVKKLLKEASALIKSHAYKPHNDTTFDERVLEVELNEEIAALSAMRASTDFENQFKQRCQWRTTVSPDLAFIGNQPEGPVNSLYWKIATVVFKPKSLGDMLSIVRPDTKQLKAVGIEDLHSTKIRRKVIQDGVQPKSNEDVMSLLLHLPHELYDDLLKYLKVEKCGNFFQYLFSKMSEGQFTKDQKFALAQAVTKHYGRFDPAHSPLHWMITTGDGGVLGAALTSYTHEQRFREITCHDLQGNIILFTAVQHPEILRVLLLSLTPQLRFAAVTKFTPVDGGVLHRAIPHPESLKVIWEALTTEQRIAIINIREENGDTFLHHLAPFPESLRIILDLLPVDEAAAAIRMPNIEGETVLHTAAPYSASLQILLRILPSEQRLKTLSLMDMMGETVLHIAFDQEKILRELPQNHRQEALQVKNKTGQTVLEKIMLIASHIIPVLKVLTEDEALALLKTKLKVKGDIKAREHSLLDICIQPQIESLFSTANFHDSFIPDFISIYSVIKEQMVNAQRNPNTFFDLGSKATALLNKINGSTTCYAIKSHVLDFFEHNPKSPITKQLLDDSELGRQDLRLAELSRIWGMNKILEDMSPA